MKENLPGAIWRVGVFLAVCALGLAAMLAIFAQLRFEAEKKTYTAEFRTVSGLENGNFVRIAGVEVGKVKKTFTSVTTGLRSSNSAQIRRLC